MSSNTLLFTLVTTAVMLAVITLAAFAFARSPPFCAGMRIFLFFHSQEYCSFDMSSL